jgi:hypothetical protein
MSLPVYEQVVREADALPRKEQLRLIARLATQLSLPEERQAPKNAPRWEDVEGVTSHPMCGEDAQRWVTRTRQESDERRGMP